MRWRGQVMSDLNHLLLQWLQWYNNEANDVTDVNNEQSREHRWKNVNEINYHNDDEINNQIWNMFLTLKSDFQFSIMAPAGTVDKFEPKDNGDGTYELSMVLLERT